MSILENPIPNEVFDNATSPLTDDRAAYKDSTYEIVSKVAYLIGVPKRIFDNEHEAPKVEVYNRLDSDKTARIIRHLCIVRTAIERNFKRINERMRFQYETILSMPEYVPQESINQLRRLSSPLQHFVKKILEVAPTHTHTVHAPQCPTVRWLTGRSVLRNVLRRLRSPGFYGASYLSSLRPYHSPSAYIYADSDP